MYRAGRVRAYLVKGAHVLALGDDGFGCELAFLELGTLGLFLILRPVVSNGSVQ
jgi:hypothetical protein